MRIPANRVFAFSLIALAFIGESGAGEHLYSVGVATVDITPDYPVRMSGYASRTSEAEGVAQRIFAKALAVGSDAEGPAILIAVDNCSVPAVVSDEVAARLKRSSSITRERFVVCSTHTHTAPKLNGVVPLLFRDEVPQEHEQHIARYTADLTDRLEQAARAALSDRRPSRIDWTTGTVGFAANRRPQGGPVDHSLPLLRVTGEDGKLRALLAAYACHCTTLEGDFNQIHGDWAGSAREMIERRHPGATALVVIGCGADANPKPRSELGYTRRHGKELADEVSRLLGDGFQPVDGPLAARLKVIRLPFDTLPTRKDWLERTQSENPDVARHARAQLQRLDSGESLATDLEYAVTCWNFGESLAFVFLPGEVVVDYALRLRRELDESRLWLTAYANDVPCYIPSERVLSEGGYEAESAMVYFDLPTRFRAGVEQRIVDAVKQLVPPSFHVHEVTTPTLLDR